MALLKKSTKKMQKVLKNGNYNLGEKKWKTQKIF